MKKNILYILGIVLVVIGVLGFFNNPVFGIFSVDISHNIVHIVTGLLAIIFAGRDFRAMSALGIVMGIVYGVLTVMGFIRPDAQLFGLMTVNIADNILHLVLTVGFLFVGFYREGVMKMASKGHHGGHHAHP